MKTHKIQTGSHTPGPWYAYVQQDMDKPTFSIDCDAGIIKCPLRMGRAEILSNAALIASAPELLAALKRIERTDMSTVGPDWLGNFCRALIGKAEGEQNITTGTN